MFAQLDSKVYERTATGPGTALMHYSKGSASDPQGREPNWNRSFELPAAAPVGGVLLLHGMSDSPYSLRALGEELSRRNYWVVGLRLPGHGTAPSGLLNVRWEDMAAATRVAAEHLAQRIGGQPLHIVGYSTGAPLALDFTLNALDGQTGPVPASLVPVSPAIGSAADERTRARADDAIDGNAQLVEHVQHADVCRTLRTAAEHESNARSGFHWFDGGDLSRLRQGRERNAGNIRT